MHELGFALKRAHLRAVAMHKPLAKVYELTPARFDALLVVWRRGGRCLQSDVRRELGLAPSTVSKMVKAMVEKGLVWRRRSAVSDRERVVGFTVHGLECVVRGIKAFIRADDVRAMWDGLFEEGRAFIARAITTVRAIGAGLGDDSTLRYRQETPSSEDIAVADRMSDAMRLDAERHERERSGHRAPRTTTMPTTAPTAGAAQAKVTTAPSTTVAATATTVAATATTVAATDAAATTAAAEGVPCRAADDGRAARGATSRHRRDDWVAGWRAFWAKYQAPPPPPRPEIPGMPPVAEIFPVMTWREFWADVHRPGYDERAAARSQAELAYYRALFAHEAANATANANADADAEANANANANANASANASAETPATFSRRP